MGRVHERGARLGANLGARVGLSLIAVAVLAGCEAENPIDDSGRAIAWVGTQKLTAADLIFAAPLEGAEQRQEVIDRGVDGLLVAREARRRGLGYTEEVVRRIVAVRRAAELRERRILRDILYDVVASEVEISEDELRDAFERVQKSNRKRRVTLRSQAFGSRESAERDDEMSPTSVVTGPMLMRDLPDVLRKPARSLDSIGDRTVTESGQRWLRIELIAQENVAGATFERAREVVEERVRKKKADEAFEAELERLRAAAEISQEPGAIENDAIWDPTVPTGGQTY